MELILYSIGFCLFIACLLIVILVYAKRMLISSALEKKEMELDHQKKMIEQMIEIQEEERNRIARELHDGVNAKLATVLLKTTSVADVRVSASISTSVREVMEISRRISYDLLPPTLENFGLESALIELFEEVNNNSAYKVSMEIEPIINQLEESYQLHVYRIVQESVQNSLKYSNGSTLDFRVIENDSHEMEIHYKDNGVGTDLSILSKGLGIRNIQTRANMVNGVVLFRSEPNKGFETCLTIKL